MDLSGIRLGGFFDEVWRKTCGGLRSLFLFSIPWATHSGYVAIFDSLQPFQHRWPTCAVPWNGFAISLELSSAMGRPTSKMWRCLAVPWLSKQETNNAARGLMDIHNGLKVWPGQEVPDLSGKAVNETLFEIKQGRFYFATYYILIGQRPG